MAASYGKSTRPEAASKAERRPRGNGYGGGTYYPYWLRGKVAHVRRVTIR